MGFLAHDLLEGRGTPSRGLDIAAEYLAASLHAAGWKPANESSYFQTFEVRYFEPGSSRYRISIAGAPLQNGEFSFIPLGLDPATTPMRLEAVFAGHGVYAPERGADDYGNADVTGKAVVALFGAPWDPDPLAPHSYDRVIGKSVQATVRGARCLVYVSEELSRPPAQQTSSEAAFIRESVKVPYAYLPGAGPTMELGPMLAIAPDVFDRTLREATSRSYSEWQQELKRGGFRARPIPAAVEITVATRPAVGRASNVAAILPGTDPALKDEWVVLTAHYDHLGSKDVPEGDDGIWNGADDNASGTAVLLETARLLAAGEPPKRSLLILFTAGEDRGLLGSAYYAQHPLVPMNKVVANVNVDMVGRSDGAVIGYEVGGQTLLARAARLASSRGLKVLPDDHPQWRLIYYIDSYHFSRFHVPSIEFFTAFHEDYHQPSDEAQKIRFKELAAITRLVAALTGELARSQNKPGFQRPEWFLTRQ